MKAIVIYDFKTKLVAHDHEGEIDPKSVLIQYY